MSSGSSASDAAVKPTRSQNSTETTLRSSRAGVGRRAVSGAAQYGQNENSPGSSLPQFGQAAIDRVYDCLGPTAASQGSTEELALVLARNRRASGASVRCRQGYPGRRPPPVSACTPPLEVCTRLSACSPAHRPHRPASMRVPPNPRALPELLPGLCLPSSRHAPLPPPESPPGIHQTRWRLAFFRRNDMTLLRDPWMADPRTSVPWVSRLGSRGGGSRGPAGRAARRVCRARRSVPARAPRSCRRPESCSAGGRRSRPCAPRARGRGCA